MIQAIAHLETRLYVVSKPLSVSPVLANGNIEGKDKYHGCLGVEGDRMDLTRVGTWWNLAVMLIEGMKIPMAYINTTLT